MKSDVSKTDRDMHATDVLKICGHLAIFRTSPVTFTPFWLQHWKLLIVIHSIEIIS